MSITINHQPQNWIPVYSPIPYNLDSTKKNEVGFNYYAEIFSGNPLQDGFRIAELNIPPAPINGLGYMDIRRLVDSYTEYNVPETTDTFTEAPKQFVETFVQFGEQTPRWRFLTNTQDGAYVEFFSTNEHNFEVGDEIVISQDADYPSELQPYEGLHTVLEVPNTTRIIIDEVYLGVNNNVGGYISHADGRAITNKNLAEDTVYCFASSFTRDEMVSYDDGDWISVQNDASSKWLTNCPDFHSIGRDDELWLSTIQNQTNDAATLFISTSGDTFNELGTYEIANPFLAESKYMVQVAVGVDQILTNEADTTIVTGTFPVFTDDVKYYSVSMQDGSSNKLVPKNYKINDEYACSRFGNKKLMFRDRKGSLQTFNFPYKSKEKRSYKRKLYNHIDFGFNDSSFYNTPTDGGQRQFTIDERTEFQVYTDFISEAEADYFVKNLIASPQVYEYQSSGVYKPVVINNGSYEIKKRYNGLIQYKLTYSYALQDYLFV
tara:strand:+ start:2064 stop:3536 length:1473 start_codon:yes stop_codon:yes gene_type:complete